MQDVLVDGSKFMKEFADDSALGKGYVSTSVKYVKKAGSGLKKIGGAAAGYAW